MARYCPLFSGSSGNCCYIGSAAGGVLVDAGVSARRIETALREREIDPGSIRAICVTHEHSDHVAGLRVLTRRYGMPVFASRGTLEELLHAGILGERDAFAVIDEEGIEVADMEITAFPTPHDSAESLGFRIHTADDRRIAVATDMGYMTPVVRKALLGCDLVHIESNHDIRMLENGPYPYFLKKRILAKTGHLSNEACAAELPQFAQEGTTGRGGFSSPGSGTGIHRKSDGILTNVNCIGCCCETYIAALCGQTEGSLLAGRLCRIWKAAVGLLPPDGDGGGGGAAAGESLRRANRAGGARRGAPAAG